MNEEKNFFKTCFNIVAGLEVKNESQVIAKEVVLSEIENLQQQCKKQKEVIDKINEFIKELYDNTDDIVCYEIDRYRKEELLDILKEVSK